jgi:hypothetical protein
VKRRINVPTMLTDRLRRAAGAVADLRARAREAVAGELAKIVADAVRDVVAAVLRAGPEPVRHETRDEREDDDYDPWDDDEADDYDHEPRAGAKPVGRNDAQHPACPPSAAPAAVTAGLAAGRWWLGRRGSVAEVVGVGLLVALAALAGGPTARTGAAVAVGLLVALAALAGGPTARTGAAVAAAVADLSATADVLEPDMHFSPRIIAILRGFQCRESSHPVRNPGKPSVP